MCNTILLFYVNLFIYIYIYIYVLLPERDDTKGITFLILLLKVSQNVTSVISV
jgi:uncharacterized membrane protein